MIDVKAVLQRAIFPCLPLGLSLLLGCGKSDSVPGTIAMPSEESTPSSEDDLSRRWREEGKEYVDAVNAFVERGMKEGWDNAGKEPEETRQRLAGAVIDAVRRANREGRLESLRVRFPPAQPPLIELVKKYGRSLPVVLLLDDGRILVQIGTGYEKSRVALIHEESVTELPDIISLGRSSNRRFYAVARKSGVAVHDGWEGRHVADFPWPTGLEGIPEGFTVSAIEGLPIITRLTPFPDGNRVLLASPSGVYVLEQGRAVRLLPTVEELNEDLARMKKEADDCVPYDLAMEHAAVSADGKWIAAGHQSSLHHVFDAKTLAIAAEIGHRSEYPHFAYFSRNSEMLALNSCHFYNGITIGVSTKLLPGLETEPYQEDSRVVTLEDGARVYAAAMRRDEFIVGDAYGYLRAFDTQGIFRWQHFIGSSIDDIDVSPDGKLLIASSCAGFLCIIDLDTGERDPFAIGTATHQERRRWLFWKNEARPLIW